MPKTSFPKLEIARSEWSFVIVVSALVFILTTIPYIYGFISGADDKQFMGVMLDMPDHMQYFSWMREFREANLSANKLTPEPNQPIFFNLLWWVMAQFDNILGLGFAGMYQILRFVATFTFLPFVYRLCAWYFDDHWHRAVAFLVVVFTSGFGWVLVLLKYTLTDGELVYPLLVYIAEGNTFLSILGYPHFIAAGLFIFVFDLFLQGERENKLSFAFAAGLFALFLGWQHAYDLISVYGILGIYGLLKWIRDKKLPVYILKAGVVVGLLSVWPALYSVWLTSADPLWKEVLAQFANAGVYTPNLLQLPVLLGLSFILACVSVIRRAHAMFRSKNDRELFIFGWFLICFILVYLPVDYQIHLINGWQIPIAFLATRLLFLDFVPAIQKITQNRKKAISLKQLNILVPLIFLALIIPTNVYLYVWRYVELARNGYPYFLHDDEVSALEWLEKNAESDDVVMSSLDLGQFIPAYTGAHAFLAHWAQTVDFYTKSQIVDDFYSDGGGGAQWDTLMEYGVDYVVLGPSERALGGEAQLQATYLQQVFSTDQVTIYQVATP